MSPGDWFWRDYPSPPAKLPPPKHGIKVKKFGSTWWGRRWITALERLGGGYASRLGRGRSYARQGRVHDLKVDAGTVVARVTGSRATPYEIELRLAPLDAKTWERAIHAMAAKARFAAALLAGEMPKEIDEAFGQARTSLFPTRDRDLVTSCTCPDWANPCKHVAAVHYVLGDALDRNPFLLFELRGRDKETVLDGLRRLRASSGTGGRRPRTEAARPRTLAVARLPREGYESLRAPVDGIRFHIGEPRVPGATLRQLGVPPSWRLASPPHALLQPAVSRAAALARELALGTPTAESSKRRGAE
jgi:uncharacterized Zn finger protein